MPTTPPDSYTTQKLPVGVPEPDEALPALPAPRRSRARLGLLGGLGLFILGAAAGLFFLDSASLLAPIRHLIRSENGVPLALQSYCDRADQGDAIAMRMLGTMYYNGLNVRRDQAEGIRWYRKAAAAGSVAARKDLEQLGLPLGAK